MNSEQDKLSTPLSTPHVCEGGNLDCGSGLLLVIRKAMDKVPTGEVLEIRSTEISVCEDLPAWCRMTENPYLGWTDEDSTNRFFVRRGAAQEDVNRELERAKQYVFQTRVRWNGGMTATVYARNHSFSIGQPASFDVSDLAPSALEYLLGSLGGCLVMGFQIHASREGIEIDQAELSLSAKPENLLVFLGLEEGGHSGLTDVTGTLYAESDAPFEKLQEIWQHTIKVSPVANTLLLGAQLTLEIRSLD